MMLVALHTVFMREHNRIALELSKINPHWDDEKIFQVWSQNSFEIIDTRVVLLQRNNLNIHAWQESRHIVAAIVQQITYNEFLPMVLGKEVMERYDLLSLRDVS